MGQRLPSATLSVTSSRPPTHRTVGAGPPPIARGGLLPLPWDLWPAEGRLMLGLVALWSLVGLLVLTSASWWVAEREMGDAAFYLKR